MTTSRFSARRRRLLGSTSLAVATWTLALLGQAQEATWPNRPVRIIVNFPPGSSPDVLIRAVAGPVQEAIGQPLVIDNRSGASGTVGAHLVARAPADGYTFLMTAGSVITTNPHVIARIPYDTAKDLVPVASLARMALFLVSRGDLPVTNIREFLAYARERPGKLSYGSAGNATGLHIAGEMLNGRAGIQTVHVPYRGAAPALQDLLAGQIDFYFDPGIAMAHTREGRLRMLAVAALQRASAFPDVPTLDEVGLKGFDAGTTHALYAPAGTPEPIVQRMNREINTALASSDVRNRIATMGAEPTPLSIAQLAELMAQDSQRYAAIIRERNIKAD